MNFRVAPKAPVEQWVAVPVGASPMAEAVNARLKDAIPLRNGQDFVRHTVAGTTARFPDAIRLRMDLADYVQRT